MMAVVLALTCLTLYEVDLGDRVDRIGGSSTVTTWGDQSGIAAPLLQIQNNQVASSCAWARSG